MQLAKRPKKQRSGRLRSQKHLTFVRKHKCLVDGCQAYPIVAHHIGDTATAAMGSKSDDNWTVPLCDFHHKQGHTTGWDTFVDLYDLDLRDAALWFAHKSPDEDIRKAAKDHG